MSYKLQIKKFRNNGFTIIETMISVALFIIVVMAGMGSLLNANLLHNKSQNERSIIDNLSFIMEDISKNLRTGYNYHCFAPRDSMPSSTSSTISFPKSCTSGWAIAFESATGDSTTLDGDPIDYDDQWVYYISNTGKIFKSTRGPYGASNFIQLTPDEISIDTSASSFSVLGAEPSIFDSQQPFVTIKLVGTITYKNVVTPFSLQTSVSQRKIDI